VQTFLEPEALVVGPSQPKILVDDSLIREQGKRKRSTANESIPEFIDCRSHDARKQEGTKVVRVRNPRSVDLDLEAPGTRQAEHVEKTPRRRVVEIHFLVYVDQKLGQRRQLGDPLRNVRAAMIGDSQKRQVARHAFKRIHQFVGQASACASRPSNSK
jgi:hypothetical protein